MGAKEGDTRSGRNFKKTEQQYFCPRNIQKLEKQNRQDFNMRSYNRQLNSLCINLMATIKDPILATSRISPPKCKRNNYFERLARLYSYNETCTCLIGSLQIKECHIKNLGPIMDYLINDITKTLAEMTA